MSATASTALPRAALGASVEEQAAAFEDDPRVHFDTQGGQWRLEDGDAEFEYEPSRAVWIPVVSSPLPAPSQRFERWTCVHAALGRRRPDPEATGGVFGSWC
jgi:hypothetical protein